MSRLVDRFRVAARARRFSPRTARVYEWWMRRFVRHCGMQHPSTCGLAEVRSFIEGLSASRRVSGATQRQAIAALSFLYRDVLHLPLDALPSTVRPFSPRRTPNVLEPPEIAAVLGAMTGPARTVAQLLYGSGLRLGEALSLRIMDVDLARQALTIRGGKGGTDRRTMIPQRLVEDLRVHLSSLRQRHLRESAKGGVLYLTRGDQDDRSASVNPDWRWAWVFPSARHHWDPFRRRRVLYPLHQSTIQRAIATAALRSGISRRVSPHTFRHSFATQLLRSGYDVRTVQLLLGHRDVSTTMVYLHALDLHGGVRSPLDRIGEAVPPAEGSSLSRVMPRQGAV